MKKAEPIEIAVIGGSGLYAMEGLRAVKEVSVKTPFGNPSERIAIGTLEGRLVAFLARHGKGHKVLPSEINARANIFALKSLGVKRIIGVGACGSLKEELAPKDLVLPDQVVDKTKGRISTFFGQGLAAHIQFDKPFCPELTRRLYESAQSAGLSIHKDGVYVCMEGPSFSTKAESLEHRRLGYSIVGMTVLPEARLAREAEICYAALCSVTDYDCWKKGEETVSAHQVIENLKTGVASVQRLIKVSLGLIAAGGFNCVCGEALKNALVTHPKYVNKLTAQKLKLLVGKYMIGARS